MDFDMALRNEWYWKAYFFLKTKSLAILSLVNPQFSIKVSGFELSYNYHRGMVDQIDDGVGMRTHQWFVLQLLDVDFFRICKQHITHVETIWEVTIFGLKWSTSTNYHNNPRQQFRRNLATHQRRQLNPQITKKRYFDWAIMNLAVAAGMVVSCAVFMASWLPETVIILIPAFTQPLGQITIYSLMVSFRTLVAWAQLQLAIINLLSPEKQQGSKWKALFYPFLHPRIILFVAIIPAIVYGFYPIVFLLTVSALITIYDIFNANQSLFLLKLPICLLDINMGCDVREGDKNWRRIFEDSQLIGCDSINNIQDENKYMNINLEQEIHFKLEG